MSKLVSSLNKNIFTLIVDLPENTLELAKAAEEGGADAIILTIDPEIKDKKQLVSIIDSAKVPVGINIKGHFSEAEVNGLKKLGVDFMVFALNESTSFMTKLEGIGKIASLDDEYAVDDLTRLHERNIQGIDAAVVPKESFGKDLNIGDLQQYITIALSTGLPVVVPTQKLVRISEVPIVWDTGAKGIIIDSMVIGKTPQVVKTVTKEFKEAVQGLKEE